jgi:hypothetical protein
MELARDGPGFSCATSLPMRPTSRCGAAVIARLSPDVVLLTGFDYDLQGHALAAWRTGSRRRARPIRIASRMPPNSGLATGRDMDGDGRAGTPRDAQGYGEFAGQGGMALLSRLSVDAGESRDHLGLPLARSAGGASGARRAARMAPSRPAAVLGRALGRRADPARRAAHAALGLARDAAGLRRTRGRNARRNHDEAPSGCAI